MFSVTVTSVIFDRVKENCDADPPKKTSMVNISSTFSVMTRALNTTLPTVERTLTSNSYCVALKNAKKPAGTAQKEKKQLQNAIHIGYMITCKTLNVHYCIHHFATKCNCT